MLKSGPQGQASQRIKRTGLRCGYLRRSCAAQSGASDGPTGDHASRVFVGSSDLPRPPVEGWNYRVRSRCPLPLRIAARASTDIEANFPSGAAKKIRKKSKNFCRREPPPSGIKSGHHISEKVPTANAAGFAPVWLSSPMSNHRSHRQERRCPGQSGEVYPYRQRASSIPDLCGLSQSLARWDHPAWAAQGGAKPLAPSRGFGPIWR